MLEKWFNTELTLVTTTRDNYGDLTYATQTKVMGLILDHTGIQLGDRKEQVNTDSIAWLPTGTAVTTDTLIHRESDTFRVVRIINARKPMGGGVHFIKCYLQASVEIAGIS